jgi:two-component system chemotaxis sensor kinase CheA
MSEAFESVEEQIENMALEIVTLEEEDIQAMGRIMNALESVEKGSKKINHPQYHVLLTAVKGYVERLILGDTKDISPLEEAIGYLQKAFRSVSRGETFQEDMSSLFDKLGSPVPVAEKKDRQEGTEIKESENSSGKSEGAQASEQTEEDLEILNDFVSESLENLASVEVNLIDLEDDPENLETINSIFRPFHTIKGISGFLNLDKINRLAHSAENLLDKARNGEIRIEGDVVDLVLESLDTLKRMIQGVAQGLSTGTALDNGLDIQPLLDKIEAFQSESENLGGKPLGEILVEEGIIGRERLEECLRTQKQKPGKKLGQILVEEGIAGPEKVVGALRSQRKFGGKKGFDPLVKVDTSKLDTLVDMTGELVIAQAMLRQNERILSIADQQLYKTLNQLNQITSTLQKTAMSLRMIPIKSTFQRMVRLVRDLARSSGKQVALRMEGADTEIDRNVVDELYEPMVHMIRNAVDHGIEDPETRKANGKSPEGTVTLRAYHRGGNIVIEIADDGKGLDRERIHAKAEAAGLITENGALGDLEVYNLIFRPGFSTAKEVTEISGRGVGMDVVKRAIEKLRGRVEINSISGRGSVFTISLPLTLAIIEGMVVGVGTERFIIPALAILESFRPDKSQYSTVEGKGEMVMVRSRLLPLVRLDRIVNTEGKYQKPWEALVVAVEYEGQQMCLQLDELLGKEEIVIKSLGQSLKHIKGLAGGAIMGDGRVGLILDIAGLFEIAHENYRLAPTARSGNWGVPPDTQTEETGSIH